MKEASFYALSTLLTGLEHLEHELTKGYLHKLEEKFPIELDELLGIYNLVANQKNPLKALTDQIKDNPTVLHAARQVVRVWYVSQFKESSDPANKNQIYAGHWDRGALWQVIKAHAPAFSNGVPGDWSAKPQ